MSVYFYPLFFLISVLFEWRFDGSDDNTNNSHDMPAYGKNNLNQIWVIYEYL